MGKFFPRGGVASKTCGEGAGNNATLPSHDADHVAARGEISLAMTLHFRLVSIFLPSSSSTFFFFFIKLTYVRG